MNENIFIIVIKLSALWTTRTVNHFPLASVMIPGTPVDVCLELDTRFVYTNTNTEQQVLDQIIRKQFEATELTTVL